MPARYFFHADAPSHDVYGPVPLETVRRWRTEGRLRDDSRVKAEGADTFTTAKDVLAAAPPPEPIPEAAPEIHFPPRLSSPTARREAIPVSRLLANTLPRYGEALRKLWWVPVLTLLPFVVFCLIIQNRIDPHAKSLPEPYLLPAVSILFFTPILFELGLGFMTLSLHDSVESASLAEQVRLLARRAFALAWTYILRQLLLSSFLIVALFCVAMAMKAPASPLLRAPIYFCAALALVAAILLFLRYLTSTLIVVLEKKSFFTALQRASDLVRFNCGSGLISLGDLRFFLTMVPALSFLIVSNYTFSLLPSLLHLGEKASLFVEALGFLATFSLATPLYVLLLLAFYTDALARVPDSEKDSTAPPRP